jgi:hypothetical protein
VIDAQALTAADVLVEPRRVAVPGPDGEPTELAGGRGWIRRLGPEGWRDAVSPAGHEGVTRSAWVTALASIISGADVEWLSGLRQMFDAEDKLAQYRAASALGIRTPPTALVTRRERIPVEFGDHLVVKPVGVGHYVDATGVDRVAYATELDRQDPALELLAGAPFFVQVAISARAHVRVVTVGARQWVCELAAADLPLDWRASEAAHDAFRPVAHDVVGDAPLRLADLMSVGYSSQDWIVDATGAVFLDLNPAGQWLFLPDSVADEVTETIAQWLVGREAAA